MRTFPSSAISFEQTDGTPSLVEMIKGIPRKEYMAEWHQKHKERRNAGNKEWRRNHPDTVRAMYQTYSASVGPHFERDRKLESKYGITKEEYDNQFVRQRGRCLISQEPFSSTPHVDHNHTTGAVRGLLSNNANAALGFLKENPEAFYRAAAYLSLDRTKKLVYLVGSLRNRGIIQTGISLRDEGYDIFDNWIAAGPEADDYWQDYTKQRGLTYKDALKSREAQHVFHFDKAYLDLSDAVVLIMPAGRSGHLELGYAVGSGKHCFILNDGEPDRFDVMPAFADFVVNSLDELKQKLKETFLV